MCVCCVCRRDAPSVYIHTWLDVQRGQCPLCVYLAPVVASQSPPVDVAWTFCTQTTTATPSQATGLATIDALAMYTGSGRREFLAQHHR